MCVLKSWVQALMGVVNRKLKAVHVTIIMFWYGLIGFSCSLICLFLWAWATRSSFMIYSSMGYLWLILGSLGDNAAVVFGIVAWQKDTSSFVSLIAYVSVVYAFLSDYFIFN